MATFDNSNLDFPPFTELVGAIIQAIVTNKVSF